MAYPVIRSICPHEGPVSGGNTIVIIGENFFDGLQVVFGNSLAWAELITPHAIKVQVPPRHAGPCEVTLSVKGKHFCRENPGIYQYNSKNFEKKRKLKKKLFLKFYFFLKDVSDSLIETSLLRLQKYVTKYPGDPDRLTKDMLLKRAADLLEWYSMSGNPHNFALPTPPSDHDAENSYNNGYASTFDG